MESVDGLQFHDNAVSDKKVELQFAADLLPFVIECYAPVDLDIEVRAL